MIHNKKQTAEFLERVEIVKRYMYENRDREVTQISLVDELNMSRLSVQSCFENLEKAGFVKMRFKHRNRLYSWLSHDDVQLLSRFMKAGKIRTQIREFRHAI